VWFFAFFLHFRAYSLDVLCATVYIKYIKLRRDEMKTATRTVEWEGQSGHCVAVITAEAGTNRTEINLDGHATGMYETTQVSRHSCKLYINDTVMASGWFLGADEITDAPAGAAAMIHGLRVDRIYVKADVWAMIKEAQEAVEAEVAEEIAEEDDEAQDVVTESAKRTIEAAEHGALVMPAAEIAGWVERYNNVYNEGGEGYIPTVIAKEALDKARSRIATK
jgi:hypothetical protein